MANPAKKITLNSADNTIAVDGVVLPVALAAGQYVNIQQADGANVLNIGLALDPQHTIETTNIPADTGAEATA